MKPKRKKNEKNEKSVKKNNNVKRKNKVKRFFAAVLFFTLILALLGGLGFGVYYLCTSSKFDIAGATVTGIEKYTQEEILKVAKIPEGKNIFLTRKGKIEDRIEVALPYVEVANISRAKNNKFKIAITERKLKYVAINSETNEYIRLDKYGIMLEKISSEDVTPEELLVLGINFDYEIKFGKSISDTEIAKLNKYDSIIDAYKRAEIESKVTSVNFEQSKVVLVLDYKLSVITEVSDELDYKMKFLKEIIKEVSGHTGEIDMTQDNPSFVEKIR